mmetsp:Transcript_11023/g.18022  ORF Transcript_11023/g.18022 Transcript_11023/m.18022 type:complete len:269 (+) Transcript_11023:1662-2468(+)
MVLVHVEVGLEQEMQQQPERMILEEGRLFALLGGRLLESELGQQVAVVQPPSPGQLWQPFQLLAPDARIPRPLHVSLPPAQVADTPRQDAQVFPFPLEPSWLPFLPVSCGPPLSSYAQSLLMPCAASPQTSFYLPMPSALFLLLHVALSRQLLHWQVPSAATLPPVAAFVPLLPHEHALGLPPPLSVVVVFVGFPPPPSFASPLLQHGAFLLLSYALPLISVLPNVSAPLQSTAACAVLLPPSLFSPPLLWLCELPPLLPSYLLPPSS